MRFLLWKFGLLCKSEYLTSIAMLTPFPKIYMRDYRWFTTDTGISVKRRAKYMININKRIQSKFNLEKLCQNCALTHAFIHSRLENSYDTSIIFNKHFQKWHIESLMKFKSVTFRDQVGKMDKAESFLWGRCCRIEHGRDEPCVFPVVGQWRKMTADPHFHTRSGHPILRCWTARR